jgi:hypothetical protein
VLITDGTKDKIKILKIMIEGRKVQHKGSPHS